MWRFTRDRTALDELTQEVLVEAYFSLKSFKGRSSFRTWLLAIATRVGYGYWRRSAREKKRDEAALRELTLERDWDEAGSGEAAETLYRVLEGLPAKERLVLTLMYFEELGVREIAGLTGWSESLVKVRAYRARRRLKVLLESEGMGGTGHE
jgi:RNA polymerase sigma-70 factor (ECF subfamily)